MAYRETKGSPGLVTVVRGRMGDDPAIAAPRRDRGLARDAILVWLALLLFAVNNGYFRQRFLQPELGEEVAHFLSTTTLCGAVVVASLLFAANRPRVPAFRELVLVGLFWSIASVLFEVILGVLSDRRSMPELFTDYDVTRGRLFAFVILVEITAPPLAGWLRRWAEYRDRS